MGASQKQAVNHATAVAEYDFGVDDEDRRDFDVEMISHTCAQAVANARINAKLSQGQLATMVNEKPAVIVSVENGSSRYDAGLINRIEQALKVQIPRGRKNNKKKNKKWAERYRELWLEGPR